MSKILGIDQALDSKAGFAVFEDGIIHYTHMETYKDIPRQAYRQRCRRFGMVVQTIIKMHTPDIVVTELVRPTQHTYALLPLAQLQGVLHVVVPASIKIFVVNTSSWQKHILKPVYPKKNSLDPRPDLKKLSVEHVRDVYGEIYPHHIADAISMCEYIELVACVVQTNILELA